MAQSARRHAFAVTRLGAVGARRRRLAGQQPAKERVRLAAASLAISEDGRIEAAERRLDRWTYVPEGGRLRHVGVEHGGKARAHLALRLPSAAAAFGHL